MRAPGTIAGRGRVGGVAAAVMAAWLSGCAGAAVPGELKPGGELCYRFEENDAFRALGLPHGLVLLGSPLAGAADPQDRRGAATLMADGTRQDTPFAAWRPLAGDSLQVGPALTGSLQLRLVATAEGLVGLGRAVGDIARPGATGARPSVDGVVAEPVTCSSAS